MSRQIIVWLDVAGDAEQHLLQLLSNSAIVRIIAVGSIGNEVVLAGAALEGIASRIRLGAGNRWTPPTGNLAVDSYAQEIIGGRRGERIDAYSVSPFERISETGDTTCVKLTLAPATLDAISQRYRQHRPTRMWLAPALTLPSAACRADEWAFRSIWRGEGVQVCVPFLQVQWTRAPDGKQTISLQSGTRNWLQRTSQYADADLDVLVKVVADVVGRLPVNRSVLHIDGRDFTDEKARISAAFRDVAEYEEAPW